MSTNLPKLKELAAEIEAKETKQGGPYGSNGGFLFETNGGVSRVYTCRENLCRDIHEVLFDKGNKDYAGKTFPVRISLNSIRSLGLEPPEAVVTKAAEDNVKTLAKRAHLISRCLAAVEDACGLKRHRLELAAKEVMAPKKGVFYGYRIGLTYKLNASLDWFLAPPLVFYYLGFVKIGAQQLETDSTLASKKLRDIRPKRNEKIKALLSHDFGKLLIERGGPRGLFGDCRQKNWKSHVAGEGFEWFTRILKRPENELVGKKPPLVFLKEKYPGLSL